MREFGTELYLLKIVHMKASQLSVNVLGLLLQF